MKNGTASDQAFMSLALAEARKGDFPFGAVITKHNQIVATGRNQGLANNNPTAHAELVAIQHFLATNPARELVGATLYATGEPCPMCMGAILWCGISRLVYAASISELSEHIQQIMIPSQTLALAADFQQIEIEGGLLKQQALALFSR